MGLLIRCENCGRDVDYDEDRDTPVSHECSSIDVNAALQPLDFDQDSADCPIEVQLSEDYS